MSKYIDKDALIAEFKRLTLGERAGTVRKMQERLKQRFKVERDAIYTGYNIHRYIDQIAKEMLEEI